VTKNVLYCGDNLEILATMEKESIDLIYIDPPFFSNRYYEIIWGRLWQKQRTTNYEIRTTNNEL